MRTRITPELVMTSFLVLSPFGCVRTSPAAPVPVPKPPVSTEVQKQLAEASDLLKKRTEAHNQGNTAEFEKLDRQFATVVRGVAPKLASVKPEETATPKEYLKLTLNAAKTKFDAFRFRVPEGKANWNLDWEFVYATNASVDSWYILPVEGTLKGFESFRVDNDWQEDFAELPAKNHRVVQDLPGGRLVPGAEYVIWFTFTDDQPVELFLRLGVTPQKK